MRMSLSQYLVKYSSLVLDQPSENGELDRHVAAGKRAESWWFGRQLDVADNQIGQIKVVLLAGHSLIEG
jgi:hypothetical protein